MMRVTRRSAAAIASAAAAALALTACGGGIKNSNATSSATTGTTGSAGGGQVTTGTAASTATTTVSTTAGETSAAGSAALAQQTVRAPDSKGGTVDIAVLGLAVHGQLATLTVRFTPHFPDKSPDDSISLYDMSNNALDQNQVSLVDPVGLKRYLVVEDSNHNALGSDEVYTAAVNNSSVVGHWTFAAPPASVSKISVEVGPFPPFYDVPISR
jgi:hypothetical protein